MYEEISLNFALVDFFITTEFCSMCKYRKCASKIKIQLSLWTIFKDLETVQNKFCTCIVFFCMLYNLLIHVIQ